MMKRYLFSFFGSFAPIPLSMLFLFFTFVTFFLFSSTALGVHCPPNYDDTTGSGICVPTTTGLSQAGVADLLVNFMKWILGIFGALAIIAFVISGVQYLTSAGDDDQISTAKRNMKYSIVGVIVALSGYVILTAIIAFLAGSVNF